MCCTEVNTEGTPLQAMNRAHETERYRESLLERVIGVAFFGTPHRGSSLAHWASMLSGILKTCLLGTSTNFQLTKSLERKSKTLEGISKSFIERGKDMQIYSFYETEKMGFMNCKVMPQHSVSKVTACVANWPTTGGRRRISYARLAERNSNRHRRKSSIHGPVHY